jgi:hypothetical protein
MNIKISGEMACDVSFGLLSPITLNNYQDPLHDHWEDYTLKEIPTVMD